MRRSRIHDRLGRVKFDDGFDADTQVTMSWGEPERTFIVRELPHPDEDSDSEDEDWFREDRKVMQDRLDELVREYGDGMARRIFQFEHDQVVTYLTHQTIMLFCFSRIMIGIDFGRR